MLNRVRFGNNARKQIRNLPKHIVRNLIAWVNAVELDGLEKVRHVPGYHDEPLKGARKHQRSIRLSKSYRAIYEIRNDDAIEFISIEEVSKHAY